MPKPASRPGLAVLLAALAAIGPFSIDTYLPAFPAISASLSATPIEVQQTLTAYLVTFAFMILWHGSFSDALGRRRVLLIGLALYALASLFCACATRIEYLWLGRALQGVSAGVGLVVGRAIVRDLFDGAAAQRLMASIGMIFAIAPAVAPIIGGWIHAFFNWHAIFVFLGLFGSALWLATFLWLPETLPPEKRQNLHPGYLLQAYCSVLAHARFMQLSAALALNFNGFFIYVLSAPVFLIQHLGVSPQGFIWLFGPCVTGLLFGSFLSWKFAGRICQRRTVALGYIVMSLAAVANILINLTLPSSLPWSVLPLLFYNCGMSLTIPSLQLLALDIFPEKRGLASSCQGMLQTCVSAVTASMLAPLFWGTPLTLALGMAGFLALGLVAASRYLLGKNQPACSQ